MLRRLNFSLVKSTLKSKSGSLILFSDQLNSNDTGSFLRLRKQTAHSLFFRGLTHISVLSISLYLNACIPRGSWLTAIISLFVRIPIVEESAERISFPMISADASMHNIVTVSYTHLRAHETVLELVCRLL